MEFTQNEIKQKYDNFARWYDKVKEPQLVLIGVRMMRKRLLQKADGKILEIGTGTGANFPYYKQNANLTAIDISAQMLKIAKKRSRKLGLEAKFKLMDAHQLGFPKNHFDTVVMTLSLCTFPNPKKALHEASRVCRKIGKILILEQGKSSLKLIGKFQDKYAESHSKSLGCIWNMNLLKLVKSSGLIIKRSHRYFFKIFHLIEAKPSH